MLCNFPSCIQGWLRVQNIHNDEVAADDLKSSKSHLPSTWDKKFCILMENDSKLYLFDHEPNYEQFRYPDHISQYRIDSELNSNSISDSCSCIDDGSITSSKNNDSDRYNSNSSLTQMNSGNKQYTKSGIFRNSSRLFRWAKSNSKLNAPIPPGREENNSQTKSVSTLKRSLSLSRLNRKKSEEKVDSKSPRSITKYNQLMTQSTGNLTMNNISSTCTARHELRKDSLVSDVHTSLVGEIPHCFSVFSLSVELHSDSDFDGRSKDLVKTKRIFAAKSLLEKQCWMKRLQQTIKPNLENENRLNNMLKLTIFESKFLTTQKRRYFCTVTLDKDLYARTTSKCSNNEGCVFWAEDLVLNNLPNIKNMSIHLYREIDPSKDSKKKKRKNSSQLIGSHNFNIAEINGKNEFESWFQVKSLDGTGNFQLRVKLRYQSLKVLKSDAYNKLSQIVTKNYLELIQFLEKNLPVKLREEIANCLVNIHESQGTIIEFLTDLISQEVNDLDNSSMTLRANTIVTKVIESHMKLVGSEYLHSMLHSFIHDVMYKNITIEVDELRINFNNESHEKVILDNQKQLIDNLKFIWNKIYCSKDNKFPKQLKLVFTGWRNILESTCHDEEEKKKIAAHCDVIVSGCIFLRLLCPAILSPHLFGLVSHFNEKAFIQRTLTLIAKSLQSLANFSPFGDKEHFMTFLNECFEEEIPRMHDFLRYISSEQNDHSESINELKEAVRKEVNIYGSTIDVSVELARLHNCLASDTMKELLMKSPKVQNIIRLPDIIREIDQQIHSSVLPIKKSQISNPTLSDQRRSSLGPMAISKIQENNKLKKDNSPPRLGSPVCQSSAVVPISEYGDHSNDIWLPRSDINFNNNSKTPKNSSAAPIIYSTKPQYTISPITKHQMNIFTPHKGHYNTRETEENQITDLSFKKTQILNSNPQYNQAKSSIPKSVQPQNKRIPTSYLQPPNKTPNNKFIEESHYIKVNDLEFNSVKRKLKSTNPEQNIDISKNEYYRENPLYDYPCEVTNAQTLEIDKYPLNTIDRYFSVRSRVNVLEQQLKQTNLDTNKSQNLQDLYIEMESIKMEVQNEQLKDLKQLKQIVNKGCVSKKMYSSLTNPHHDFSNSNQKQQSNLVTTDTLDDVINNITLEGAGLEETQISLRRQHMKKDKCSIGKVQSSSSTRPRQQSLGTIANMINNENVMQSVQIDFSESQTHNSLPSQPIKSQSSSNCSSTTPWLI